VPLEALRSSNLIWKQKGKDMTSSLIKLSLHGNSQISVPAWFAEKAKHGPDLIGPHVDPSLRDERSNASFDSRELTHILNGGVDQTVKIEYFRYLVAQEKVFRKEDRYSLSKAEQYERAMEKFYRFRQIVTELKLKGDDYMLFVRAIDEHFPTFLHDGLFVTTILGQGTEEQIKKWLPLCENYQIIGCYAQTELGHGSNVRGLETIAKYVKETDEFELHSPTLTSMKWWPGALAKTSTHALVMGRLIIGQKEYGVAPFILQIRSLDDHRTLPGITLGDIGPKYGFNSVDNGYMKLDRVRIPRENMLMRNVKVDRNGQYSEGQSNKLVYGTMVAIRAGMVAGASEALGRAITVAIRYSAVRRQFPEKTGPYERQVLDYQSQQYRLFPLLASSYALHFTGIAMDKLYGELMDMLNEDEASSQLIDLLSEVHATSSGLKSLVTTIASAGIEEARKCCGGFTAFFFLIF